MSVAAENGGSWLHAKLDAQHRILAQRRRENSLYYARWYAFFAVALVAIGLMGSPLRFVDNALHGPFPVTSKRLLDGCDAQCLLDSHRQFLQLEMGKEFTSLWRPKTQCPNDQRFRTYRKECLVADCVMPMNKKGNHVMFRFPSKHNSFARKHLPVKFEALSTKTLRCLADKGSVDVANLVEKTDIAEAVDTGYRWGDARWFHKQALYPCGVVVGYVSPWETDLYHKPARGTLPILIDASNPYSGWVNWGALLCLTAAIIGFAGAAVWMALRSLNLGDRWQNRFADLIGPRSRLEAMPELRGKTPDQAATWLQTNVIEPSVVVTARQPVHDQVQHAAALCDSQHSVFAHTSCFLFFHPLSEKTTLEQRLSLHAPPFFIVAAADIAHVDQRGLHRENARGRLQLVHPWPLLAQPIWTHFRDLALCNPAVRARHEHHEARLRAEQQRREAFRRAAEAERLREEQEQEQRVLNIIRIVLDLNAAAAATQNRPASEAAIASIQATRHSYAQHQQNKASSSSSGTETTAPAAGKGMANAVRGLWRSNSGSTRARDAESETPAPGCAAGDDEEKESCPICMSDFEAADSVVSWPCDIGHTYHDECLNEWLKQDCRCPLCRHEVESAPPPPQPDPAAFLFGGGLGGQAAPPARGTTAAVRAGQKEDADGDDEEEEEEE